MSIALVQSNAAGVTGTAPLTLTLNGVTAGNNLIVVAATQSSTPTSSTIADSNGTFNLAIDSGTPSVAPCCHVMIWYQESAAGGTHNITITQAVTARSSFGILMEWNGLFGSSSLDKVASNTATAAQTIASGATGATSSRNELVIAGVAVISSVGVPNLGLTDPPPQFISLGASQNDVATTSIGAEVSYFLASYPAVMSTAWAWTDANTIGSAAAIATFQGILAPDPLDAQICL